MIYDRDASGDGRQGGRPRRFALVIWDPDLARAARQAALLSPLYDVRIAQDADAFGAELEQQPEALGLYEAAAWTERPRSTVRARVVAVADAGEPRPLEAATVLLRPYGFRELTQALGVAQRSVVSAGRASEEA